MGFFSLRSFIVALFCLVAMVGNLAFAQGTTSRSVGTVLDSSGSPVPNAAVRLANEATGVAFTTRTTDAGLYVFENVQVGD